VVTALNPLIEYSQGAELVKEAASRNMTIHDIAVEKAKNGRLKNVNGDRLITADEVEAALGDLRRLT
jgi:fumarate hydratase class II